MDKREVTIYLSGQNGSRDLLGHYVFSAGEFERLEKHFRELSISDGMIGCYECAERCPDNASLLTPKRLMLRIGQISLVA